MSEPMSRQKFVDALAAAALREVVSGELDVLRHPPGRAPRRDVVARSQWFTGLDPDDQAFVIEMMNSVGFGVLHRVLCIVDGVAAINDGREPGTLRLLWLGSNGQVDLTDAGSEPDLHDLLVAPGDA
jgi:hypothetical protein